MIMGNVEDYTQFSKRNEAMRLIIILLNMIDMNLDQCSLILDT